MRRTLLIARREYLAYVRTVGFWLSLLALPAFASAGAIVPLLIERAEPQRVAALVEAPGAEGLADAVRQAADAAQTRRLGEAMRIAALPEAGPRDAEAVARRAEAEGRDAGLRALAQAAPRAAAAFRAPRDPVRLTDAPPALVGLSDEAIAERAPDLVGEGAGLDALVILRRDAAGPAARVWSARAGDRTVERAIQDALADAHRREALAAAGLDPGLMARLEAFRPSVQVFSPSSAGGGEVSLRDRLPGVIGFAAGFLLWSLIITGASILMNSVMEEKANRVLEVLLSSASPTEILAGKVLGVAVLTATVLAVWGGLSGAALGAAMPGVAADVAAVLLTDGLWAYLLAFLAGGYLMYAVTFAAIGAFCETPRDAQTLMGPVMMVLIVPLLALQMAVRDPDAVVVKALSWFPLFTPFLMSARVPSGPPVVEVAGALAGMALTAALMAWLAARAFRAGALSAGGLNWRGLWARLTGGAARH